MRRCSPAIHNSGKATNRALRPAPATAVVPQPTSANGGERIAAVSKRLTKPIAPLCPP